MPSPKSPDDLDRSISALVRARRLELGLSQGDLAEALGVTFQQVQKYENGTNRISAGRLWRLAAMLEVEPAWFFEQGGLDRPSGRI